MDTLNIIVAVALWPISWIGGYATFRLSSDNLAYRFPSLGSPDEQWREYWSAGDLPMILTFGLGGPLAFFGGIVALISYFNPRWWKKAKVARNMWL